MSSTTNCKVGANTLLVTAGIAKVFVGEIVECARTVMEEWGDTGIIIINLFNIVRTYSTSTPSRGIPQVEKCR